MTGGFFKIQRKFFLHPLWQENRTYSRAEAFLDLLQLAAFAPCRRLSAGVMVELSVGQLIGSERYLGGRWKWSTNKVRGFFQTLVTEKMLSIEKKREGSILTLCNYERYANEEIADDAPMKRRRSTNEAPMKRIEEGKELEEGKNTTVPSGTAVSYPEIIEAIWRSTPKTGRERSSKKQLHDSWKKCRTKPAEEFVHAALRAWVTCDKWTRDNGRFVEGIHLWVDNRRWEELPETQKNQTPTGGKPSSAYSI